MKHEKIKETVIPLVGKDGKKEKVELLNSYFPSVVSQKEKEVQLSEGEPWWGTEEK